MHNLLLGPANLKQTPIPACGGREFLLRRENFACGERISRLRRELKKAPQLFGLRGFRF